MIDAFADKQTSQLAEKTIVVGYGARGFHADVLLDALQQLDLSQFLGCVYGSGFEAQPAVLKKIAQIIRLIGNTAEVVTIVKTAAQFFTVLTQLDIPHPEVTDVLPDHVLDRGFLPYLKKFAGGCGGVHVEPVSVNQSALLANEYYQRQMDGVAVSLLFIADGREIETVGFNEQWLAPCDNMPFRYGGAAGQVALASNIRQQLKDAAAKLTAAFGLLGLNSIDAIVQGDVVYVLEVNPRLSATVDLYDSMENNLIHRHVQVSLGQDGFSQSKLTAGCRVIQSKAHAVVYAIEDTDIEPAFVWPDWAVDTPYDSGQTVKILAGDPVCTVISHAERAELAMELAKTRVEIIRNRLDTKQLNR